MSRRKGPRPDLLVTIDRLEPKGASGLATDGRRWRIRNAPLGATVRARPGKKETGRLLAVEAPSSDAVTPACPVFGTCGGCQLQDSPLSHQRAAKAELVSRIVGLPLSECDGAPAAYGIRNKLELSFGARRFRPEAELALDPEGKVEGSFLGFHPPGWFSRVVPVRGCPLGSAAMNAVIAHVVVRGLAPAWDNQAHTGTWRHLVVREGGPPEDPHLVVSLVTSSAADPAEVEALAQELLALPAVRGVRWLRNDGVAEVAEGEEAAVWGLTRLDMPLGPITLSLPPEGFFQVNTAGAQVLLGHVAAALGTGGTLVDLYCGAGAFGLALAEGFERVIGVEIVEPAVVLARENAARNGVAGEWHAGAVEAVLPGLALPDDAALLVDPPRVGLHPAAARFLAAQPGRVLVYVACSAASLARDREILEAGGWRLVGLTAVDLFPQSPHVEAVGRFER